MHGILNLDKPAGTTSAAVVGRVKRLLPRGTKIGHAGTLDPFATGVLLLLVSRATKWCEPLMDQPKRYQTTVRLGATTATDDLESPAVPFPNPASPPTADQLHSAVAKFTGPILQMPPAYSALKVGGRRAYDLARAGTAVALAPRQVMVYAIAIDQYQWPDVRLTVDCGRGFYVRSLARELGEFLKVGGYLTALRRTRVGPFDVAEAVTPDSLTTERLSGRLRMQDGTPVVPQD
jgi:tRNA pseudouridine55 synthase